MSALTSDSILAQLRGVKYPGYSRDIVSFGMVKDVQIDGTRVSVRIAVTTADAKVPKQIEETAVAALESIPGVSEAVVHLDVSAPVTKALQAEGGALPQTKIDGVKHIVAVASGKGGVGKSTVAVNLALAMRALGWRIGLMDADVYGPSVAMMVGEGQGQVAVTKDRRIVPMERFGIRYVSMALFLNDASPVIWRGPMVAKLETEFLYNVEWGDLDILDHAERHDIAAKAGVFHGREFGADLFLGNRGHEE